ncbi:MAG TPA: 50S ribosomal protein L21 [Patescibacteria group bacterium]|nr:50S ribosomal protein L21 [Patescibacteria group bacterium]
MQAVIETGGKQYLVSPKEKLAIEKIAGAAGDTVAFDKVLLTIDGDKVSLGKPYLANQKVSAKIVEQSRAEKLTVFKYRAKSRYRRKTGHRQSQTIVEIQ